MPYYIEARKKDSAEWKPYTEQGKLVVFRGYESARDFVSGKTGSCHIIVSAGDILGRQSNLHNQKYKIV